MTGIGSILWIVAIGLLFYFMLRKGSKGPPSCCGGPDDEKHSDHEGHTHDGQEDIESEKQHKGGCCG